MINTAKSHAVSVQYSTVSMYSESDHKKTKQKKLKNHVVAHTLLYIGYVQTHKLKDTLWLGYFETICVTKDLTYFGV